jgi:hypothetical protein
VKKINSPASFPLYTLPRVGFKMLDPLVNDDVGNQFSILSINPFKRQFSHRTGIA